MNNAEKLNKAFDLIEEARDLLRSVDEDLSEEVKSEYEKACDNNATKISMFKHLGKVSHNQIASVIISNNTLTKAMQEILAIKAVLAD